MSCFSMYSQVLSVCLSLCHHRCHTSTPVGVHAMASQIITYVGHVGEFFASQKKLLPAAKLGDSISTMHATVKKQIQNLKSIEPAEAAALNSAIQKSAFPQDAKEDLAVVVLKQLSVVVDDDDTGKGQVLLCPYNYCTRSDITYCEDLMKTQQQVALKMRQCMKRVGCIKPSEKTFAAMAAMLACLRDPNMTMVALHALVLDLKQVMSTPPGTAVEIKKYPELAKDLPDAIWKRAYSDESPVHVSLPDFSEIFDRCPRRNSHAAVKGASGRSSSATSASSTQAASAASAVSSSGLSESGIQTMIASFAKKYIADQTVQVVDAAPIQGAMRVRPCGNTRYQIVPTDDRSPPGSPSGLGDEQAEHPSPHDRAAMIDDDDPDADDIVGQMEAMAAGGMRRKPAAAKKRPASADHISKRRPGSGGSKVLKRPVAKAQKLGCSRCRGGRLGCISCRSPAFTGRRFRRK